MVGRTHPSLMLFVLAAALLAGGCSGTVMHRESLDSTGKIALVSAVMPRIADTGREGNRKVLQATIDHVAVQVRAGLAGARPWKVLEAEASVGKAAQSFGKISAKDIAVLFPQQEEQNRVREAAGRDLGSWRERFIAAAGQPVIPREALTPDEEGVPVDQAVRTVVLREAARLCEELKVDAVAFAQVRAAVTHPRENAFIVTDERTDGMLALSATLVIVDKSGRIAADMGLRPLDGRSPSRDMLPLYRGAGKESVAAANIDLADPAKKVQRALTVLSDEAVADLVTGLKEGLKQ